MNWEGRSESLGVIEGRLQSRGAFGFVKVVPYQDTTAQLWVAETSVSRYRAAKAGKKGRKHRRAGRPLPLRYVVAHLRDVQGKVLARWILLGNVPPGWADAEKLAF